MQSAADGGHNNIEKSGAIKFGWLQVASDRGIAAAWRQQCSGMHAAIAARDSPPPAGGDDDVMMNWGDDDWVV